MLPAKLKRTEMDPNAEIAKHDTAYRRPEQIDRDANEKRLLEERLAGQHEQMEGQSANMSLLDRTNRKDWPEGADITAAETPGN